MIHHHSKLVTILFALSALLIGSALAQQDKSDLLETTTQRDLQGRRLVYTYCVNVEFTLSKDYGKKHKYKDYHHDDDEKPELLPEVTDITRLTQVYYRREVGYSFPIVYGEVTLDYLGDEDDIIHEKNPHGYPTISFDTVLVTSYLITGNPPTFDESLAAIQGRFDEMDYVENFVKLSDPANFSPFVIEATLMAQECPTPTMQPSGMPTTPTAAPSSPPTGSPTATSSASPTGAPSASPTTVYSFVYTVSITYIIDEDKAILTQPTAAELLDLGQFLFNFYEETFAKKTSTFLAQVPPFEFTDLAAAKGWTTIVSATLVFTVDWHPEDIVKIIEDADYDELGTELKDETKYPYFHYTTQVELVTDAIEPPPTASPIAIPAPTKNPTALPTVSPSVPPTSAAPVTSSPTVDPTLIPTVPPTSAAPVTTSPTVDRTQIIHEGTIEFILSTDREPTNTERSTLAIDAISFFNLVCEGAFVGFLSYTFEVDSSDYVTSPEFKFTIQFTGLATFEDGSIPSLANFANVIANADYASFTCTLTNTVGDFCTFIDQVVSAIIRVQYPGEPAIPTATPPPTSSNPQPTRVPNFLPSILPTSVPSFLPSEVPSAVPSLMPTSRVPTQQPSIPPVTPTAFSAINHVFAFNFILSQDAEPTIFGEETIIRTQIYALMTNELSLAFPDTFLPTTTFDDEQVGDEYVTSPQFKYTMEVKMLHQFSEGSAPSLVDFRAALENINYDSYVCSFPPGLGGEFCSSITQVVYEEISIDYVTEGEAVEVAPVKFHTDVTVNGLQSMSMKKDGEKGGKRKRRL